MTFLVFLPFVLQIAVIGFDEFYFHVRRGLPKWERIGHPLDTLTVLVCFAFLLFVPYSSWALKVYIGLALFSCLFVTKDEFVHKEHCPASEQWLHALLFLNHPVVLTLAGLMWAFIHEVVSFNWLNSDKETLHFFLVLQTIFTALFLLYQTLYWNVLCKNKTAE